MLPLLKSDGHLKLISWNVSKSLEMLIETLSFITCLFNLFLFQHPCPDTVPYLENEKNTRNLLMPKFHLQWSGAGVPHIPPPFHCGGCCQVDEAKHWNLSYSRFLCSLFFSHYGRTLISTLSPLTNLGWDAFSDWMVASCLESMRARKKEEDKEKMVLTLSQGMYVRCLTKSSSQSWSLL